MADWPGGGSDIGLLCGIVAGGIIGFEMLLWPRKALRRLRLLPAKHWMAAHIWFGLACLPIAILHSGFHLGGWLPTILMSLLLLTVLSGIYGLIIQNILPKWMLRNLPAETICAEIDHVAMESTTDLRLLLVQACGPDRENEQTDKVAAMVTAQQETVAKPSIVGTTRNVGRLSGRTLVTTQIGSCEEDAEVLWDVFNRIESYLRLGANDAQCTIDVRDAERIVEKLRKQCTPISATIIDAMEQACQHRQQFDIQRKVHAWLHGWIPVHLGLSIGLVVFLAAHVWTAVWYW